MGPRSGDEQLLAGRQALEAARWQVARGAFEAALATADTPDAHDGLAQALWFLGEVEAAIAARQRAFDDYLRDDRRDAAARAAVWVSHQYLIAGRASAARGWLSRAERALEGLEPGAGHGWIAVERARHAEDVERCAELAEQAMTIARAVGTADLEVFALSVLGRAVVSAGRRQEGMRLLEEAMAAASAGRVRDVHSLGEAYCNLILACTAAGEWELASEWCHQVDDFAREHDATPLLGSCRTVHADVLLAAGRWADAERALESALAAHARAVPAMGAPTLATLAELRVQQGRLAEAAELLEGREEHGSALRALAHLRLAEGRPEVAVALLRRALAAAGDDAMGAAQLLAPLVDACVASGDAAGAQDAADALARIATRTGMRVVEARAHLSAARVAHATGRADAAAEPARRALAAFTALDMPHDVAQSRLELARALAVESPALAAEEARAALEVFRRIGAARAMDAAAAVLRDLGAGTAARPRRAGNLTAREEDVLELLALGMTNAQIAESLFISVKTAGHHVSHILSKLGVRNRAEAAVHAAARAERTGSRTGAR